MGPRQTPMALRCTVLFRGLVSKSMNTIYRQVAALRLRALLADPVQRNSGPTPTQPQNSVEPRTIGGLRQTLSQLVKTPAGDVKTDLSDGANLFESPFRG